MFALLLKNFLHGYVFWENGLHTTVHAIIGIMKYCYVFIIWTNNQNAFVLPHHAADMVRLRVLLCGTLRISVCRARYVLMGIINGVVRVKLSASVMDKAFLFFAPSHIALVLWDFFTNTSSLQLKHSPYVDFWVSSKRKKNDLGHRPDFAAKMNTKKKMPFCLVESKYAENSINKCDTYFN